MAGQWTGKGISGEGKPCSVPAGFIPFPDITRLLISLGAALQGTELRYSYDACPRYNHLFLTAPFCQLMYFVEKEVRSGSQVNFITVYFQRSLLGR